MIKILVATLLSFTLLSASIANATTVIIEKKHEHHHHKHWRHCR